MALAWAIRRLVFEKRRCVGTKDQVLPDQASSYGESHAVYAYVRLLSRALWSASMVVMAYRLGGCLAGDERS